MRTGFDVCYAPRKTYFARRYSYIPNVRLLPLKGNRKLFRGGNSVKGNGFYLPFEKGSTLKGKEQILFFESRPLFRRNLACRKSNKKLSNAPFRPPPPSHLYKMAESLPSVSSLHKCFPNNAENLIASPL